MENMVNDIQLNALRNQAFEKLKIGNPEMDLSKFTIQEEINIAMIEDDFRNNRRFKRKDTGYAVCNQIYKDLENGYKKYDVLAMWLDPINGLAAKEPELIKRIAIEVGGLKEK